LCANGEKNDVVIRGKQMRIEACLCVGTGRIACATERQKNAAPMCGKERDRAAAMRWRRLKPTLLTSLAAAARDELGAAALF
jgi:hypothetical protein